jgi:DNA-binding transcriptional MerR regulator
MAVIDTPKKLHELDGVPIGRIYELVDELRASNKNLVSSNKMLKDHNIRMNEEVDELKAKLAEFEEKYALVVPIKGQRIELEPGERLIIDAGFY